VLVVSLSLGWEGRAIGIAAPIVLYGLFALWHLRARGFLVAAPSRESVREITIFSLPLMPHTLASVVIASSDRFFLETLRGSAEVGVYSVGYSFGMVVMLFTDAFAKAWSPWLLRSMKDADAGEKRRVVRVTYRYLAVLLAGTALYAWLAVRVLPLMVGPDFVAGRVYIPWVCAGYAAFGVYQIFFPYLVLMERTHFLAFSSGLAALVNLAANYVLIGEYGAIGGAWATLLSYCISAGLVAGYVIRRYPMPWRGAPPT
jgi:O-antigen/teichoic acid export membrane protein